MRLLCLFAAAGLSIAALSAAAQPAAAGTLVRTGDTTGGLLYNRVLDEFPVLAEFGAAVPFATTRFTVDAAGVYQVRARSLTQGYDPFLTLYAGSFDPADPTIGWVASNDDLNGVFGSSGVEAGLLAGVTYFAVVAGFENADFGKFELTISGPGAIAAVPEPATWTLLVGGFALAGAALRRQRRAVLRA